MSRKITGVSRKIKGVDLSTRQKIGSSKQKVIESQFGLRSPVSKEKFITAKLVDPDYPDIKEEGKFTQSEFKRMKKRAQLYSMKVDKTEVGAPITSGEWDKLDERKHNWDTFIYVTKSGKKVELLATHKESKKGLERVSPSYRRKKKKQEVSLPGQQTLRV